MGKNERMLLMVGLLGFLVILAMAFADRWLYSNKVSSDAQTTTLDAAPAEDSGTEPMSTSDAPAFVIDPAQSDIRFSLGETLGGEPVTVVGDSDDFSGTIYFDIAAPQDAQIGEIVVDARGLETDNSFRNRAIHGMILSTNTFPTINFVPTSISGLPESVTMGESVAFKITGDLTVKDVTREVVFSAEVTTISETRLEGHAETMVAHADYDILIPSAPRVADVDDEVLLEIDFVALAE